MCKEHEDDWTGQEHEWVNRHWKTARVKNYVWTRGDMRREKMKRILSMISTAYMFLIHFMCISWCVQSLIDRGIMEIYFIADELSCILIHFALYDEHCHSMFLANACWISINFNNVRWECPVVFLELSL
jgi:hypothetical protein